MHPLRLAVLVHLCSAPHCTVHRHRTPHCTAQFLAHRLFVSQPFLLRERTRVEVKIDAMMAAHEPARVGGRIKAAYMDLEARINRDMWGIFVFDHAFYNFPICNDNQTNIHSTVPYFISAIISHIIFKLATASTRSVFKRPSNTKRQIFTPTPQCIAWNYPWK